MEKKRDMAAAPPPGVIFNMLKQYPIRGGVYDYKNREFHILLTTRTRKSRLRFPSVRPGILFFASRQCRANVRRRTSRAKRSRDANSRACVSSTRWAREQPLLSQNTYIRTYRRCDDKTLRYEDTSALYYSCSGTKLAERGFTTPFRRACTREKRPL